MNAFRDKEDVEQTLRTYGDMILKICITLLGNRYDAEDVLQETFIAYMMQEKAFEKEELKRAKEAVDFVRKVLLNLMHRKIFWKNGLR